MGTIRLKDMRNQRIHMVGIGGASMAGLAEMLFHDGYLVSGSDSAESYALKRLRKLNLDVRAGHYPEMVTGASLLVYSAAIAVDDPERVAAQRLGIPQMERAVLLGEIMQDATQQVCVSGTHGKTTTTAMLAQMLHEIDADPTVHLGGSLDAIGGSIRIGQSGLFVAEACEFNRSFLHMPVTMAMLLNIEVDHLDCYGSMDAVEAAYVAFLERLPEDGLVLALGDDERVIRVINQLTPKRRRILTFGNTKGCDYSFAQLEFDQKGNAFFDIRYQNETLCAVHLSVPGLYNALHALAAIAAVHQLGFNPKLAASALTNYIGARRRFEHTGVVQRMYLYHDYGHNPAEMRVAIGMAKLQNKRVIAVMQPHTFSRVKTLFDEYLTCTEEADITLVTDIYAAREKDPGDINTPMLIEGMKAHGINAIHTPTFDDTETWLLENGKPGDLVLTMGCGNINLLNDQMQENEKRRTSTSI
ncbi:MAG: UDP-N-acetylmuramate--L-alanine ligase [Clostridiales bacterium]|nr:UDP-N-acetylmuramate--L-alanine ligase [Clostridiales bacterium]